MTLTQSRQSRTKKSCGSPVRGETLKSWRMVKMRKLPADFESIFCQGLIIRVLKSFVFCGPALFHERQQVGHRFLVGLALLLRQLPRALVELRGHRQRLLF